MPHRATPVGRLGVRRHRRTLHALIGALCVGGTLAAQAEAADPVLPFSQVEPGMVGEARTVVEGTEIVTFPVRVLALQHSGDAPGGALILARAEGPLMERTGGVAEGMSGSPVYVTGSDGVARMIGAIAYGSGDQANVVIGITPIEQMLQSAAGARAFGRTARDASAPVRRTVRVADRATAVRLERRRPDRLALYPLMRWMAAGISPRLVGPLRGELARRGVALTSVGPRTVRPTQDLIPGATMTVLLAGGDLAVGAIGTVTWRDGDRVLGFGHPFLGAGRTRLLLGDGYVLQTIAAPIAGTSHKLAEPGVLQGTVVADRSDGVSARLGRPDAIPVVSSAEDRTRGTRSVVRALFARDERFLPLLGEVAQNEPLARVSDGVGGGTLQLTIRIESRALTQPLVYRNLYAAYGDISQPANDRLALALAALTQNANASVPIDRVRVDQRVERAVRAGRIVAARVHPASVRPGARVTLVLRLAPWRAGAVDVRVPFRVPAGLAPGRHALRVLPNTGEGFLNYPPEFEELNGNATAPVAAPSGWAPARVDARAAGAPGPRVRRAVGLARSVLGARNDAVRVVAPGQTRAQGAVLPTGYVIIGRPVTTHVRVHR